MALAPDSITITDQPAVGGSQEHAGKIVSGKFHPVFMQADPDGHLQGSVASYLLYQEPRVTTAAATDFLDLFNATGSGKIVRVRGIWPVQEITAASALIPSFKFTVSRTSSVGSGGTTATFEGASPPATGLVNIARLSTVDAPTLSASITCRALPTGGATLLHYLFTIPLMSEETNPAPYLSQGINWLPQLPYNPPFELQENQGMKIRQITAVASTGTNFGWLVAFAVIP